MYFCVYVLAACVCSLCVGIFMYICACVRACVCVRVYMRAFSTLFSFYSKTCVRQPPLKLTLVVDVERWLSYKGTCHVILLAKLHDMYLYKTDNFFHINHYLKSVSKVALLHRFYCIHLNTNIKLTKTIFENAG